MTTLLPLVGIFLPLYPLSIVHNLLFTRMRHPLLRSVLLLAWPQLGVSALAFLPGPIPAAFAVWGLATAGFYALRLLTVRDLGQWAAMFATSALALVWGLAAAGVDADQLREFSLCFSVPAAMLTWVAGGLERRFGSAYAGLPGGLTSSHPRLAGALALTALAAVATPVFPGFFALLGLLHTLDVGSGLAVLAIWLGWSWASALLFQGFLFGAARPRARDDLTASGAWSYAAVLLAFAATGLIVSGGGL